jgi:hypothetical protein
MAEKLGARKNSSWKAVCTAPDFCKTPVGSSTPPIPYQVIADLGQSEDCVTNVRFNGDPCKVLDQSVVPKCTGDEPGTAKGVKSGTVSGKVKPTGASTTVRAAKKRVVRDNDPCTLNDGNCPGLYMTQPAPAGAMGAGGKPTGANPSTTMDTANEIQAAEEKKGIWGTLSGPVHFVLGAAGFIPGLGAIPDVVDAGVYALEGDAISAGLSLGAAVPFAGDAVKATTVLGKAGKQVAKEAAERAAKEAAEKAAKKAAERSAIEAAERAAREAAEKKTIRVAGEAAARSGKRGDGVKVKGKGKGPCDHLKKGKGEGPYRGGAHSETNKPINDGKDSHHMPAKDSSPLEPGQGPAIQMEPKDHRMTASNGTQGLKGAKYRDQLAGLIAQGMWREAILMEIRDIRKIARKTGDSKKYNEAMLEMLEYFRCLEKNGLLK